MKRFISTRGVASARAVFLFALAVAVLLPCWADAQRPDSLPYAVTPGRTAGSEAAGTSTEETDVSEPEQFIMNDSCFVPEVRFG